MKREKRIQTTGDHPNFMQNFVRLIGRAIYWLGWPGIHIILSGSVRTRVFVLSPEGQCLLVKPYLGNGRWKLPGGGIRRSEDAVQATERELHEELGIVATSQHIEHLADARMSEEGHRYDARIMGLRLTSDTPFVLRRWEIAEARWLSLSTALETISDDRARDAVKLWAAG